MIKRYVSRLYYLLIALSLTVFAAALILKPERYISVCLDGIKLWALSVLPALFPFMVICSVFTCTGIAARAAAPLAKFTKIFKLPSAAAPCFIMSVTSGYPAGSRTVSEFYSAGCITADGAKKLACLCSTTGPLFAVGTVGAVFFGDGAQGAKLFAAHALSVLAVGIIYSAAAKPTENRALPPVIKKDALRESFYGAVSASLTAGAFIVFFYTAAAVIGDLKILYPLELLLSLFTEREVAAAVCTGIVEMTGGCALLAETDSIFALPFAGFLVTFGGVCVLLQQLCYLTKAGVKPAGFVFIKFLQGVLCFCLLLVIG